MYIHVVKRGGSKKHHLQLSMFSDKTICGRSSVYTEFISTRDVELDFCQKCWAFIGKQMVGEFLGLDFWDRADEYYRSSGGKTSE